MALGAGCVSGSGDGAAKRPNIVLIINDQHNPRHMGWTGRSQAITPRIDQFAAESACFTNAYATSPVCAPTRHTLYTGLYPAEHGVLGNGLPMREGIPTLAGQLVDAG